MKPMTKPIRSAEQKAQEEAIRRQHAVTPLRGPPVGVLDQDGFAAILGILAKFKAARENQGLTVSEVATRMGIEAPALVAMETGKMLNPTLATLCRWAEALGRKLDVDLRAD
ncbi:MAG: helix-turn-helix transcriptional regulator [Planctomycetes bacterium]|nr:helix-turn-helix transcriptional regulator [Planctomycetota bacterium]